MKILVADDEETACLVISHHIRLYPSPYTSCKIVRDGEELMEEVRSWKPDLVFTDIRMPGLSGLDAISVLKNEDDLEGISFYILSGYSYFSYARQAIHLGVRDYLLKPVRKEQLLQILHKEETERLPGISLAQAWALHDQEKAEEISLSIQRLAMLKEEGLSDEWQKELSHWVSLTETEQTPIEAAYFEHRFGKHLECWRDQTFRLQEMAQGSSSGGTLLSDALRAFLDAHYAEPSFCMDMVAGNLGYSSQYISILCKKELGRKFSELVTEKRMVLAKKLLSETNLLVKEVGMQCGYPHASYFIKLFSETTGLSPQEWRKRTSRAALSSTPSTP